MKKQNELLDLIKNIENPYPKDIFRWDNKEKLNFNRGRFNEFIHKVVEDTKQRIIEEIERSDKK